MKTKLSKGLSMNQIKYRHNEDMSTKWKAVRLVVIFVILLCLVGIHIANSNIEYNKNCGRPLIYSEHLTWDDVMWCAEWKNQPFNGYQAVGQIIMAILVSIAGGTLVWGIGYGLTKW